MPTIGHKFFIAGACVESADGITFQDLWGANWQLGCEPALKLDRDLGPTGVEA
jgi:hypothetical protein